MKNGYYVVPRYCTKEKDSLSAQNVGILNKIEMQVRELSKYFNMKIINIYLFKEKNNTDRILSRLPFISESRDYNDALNQIDAPCFIYIRNCPPLDRDYIAFIKTLRERYSNCKIIVEVPTYPYDSELFSLAKQKPLLKKDKIYREKYKLYVDRISVFSKDKTVFGIKTLNLMNGINVNDTLPVSHQYSFNKKLINMIFVGTMRQHHGLERIIKGLFDYYSEESRETVVRLLLVGDGPEQSMYKALVEKYSLQPYVIFYGKKEGNELDDLYNQADIALNSFGLYKLGLDWLSSIKSREYIAKGLPTVNGCPTDVFVTYPSEFCIDFPNDDSVICVNKIVDWYSELMTKYQTPNEMAREIRKYALEYVDNSVVLKPVIDYIQGK